MAKKFCNIIGSNKGGVGKSLLSSIHVMIAASAGIPLRVIEIDNEQKLSSELGDRVTLSLKAFIDINEASKNRYAAASYYNKAYEEMQQGHSLIDLGANVTKQFFDWFEKNRMGEFAAEDDIEFRFLACAAPDKQAIAAALSAYQAAHSALGPNAKYFIALNEMNDQDAFAPYIRDPQFQIILDLEKQGKLQLVRIKHCDSRLFEIGKAMRINPIEMPNRADEIAAVGGLNEIDKRIHKRNMIEWVRDVQVALRPFMLYPREG